MTNKVTYEIEPDFTIIGHSLNYTVSIEDWRTLITMLSLMDDLGIIMQLRTAN